MSAFPSTQAPLGAHPLPQTQPLSQLSSLHLPISHLESLKFKANQIIDSIVSLQNTIAAGNQAVMPSWPEILSKYNIILSQTHSFSMNLMSHPPSSSAASAASSSRSAGGSVNQLEKIALHPSVGMTDAQLDGEVIPLLRNQQTLDVLRVENESVRRLAEHMSTRGSVSVLGGAPPAQPAHAFGFAMGAKKPVEYEDVLKECEEIRGAHDRRVDRAVRAVMMLREKFDWKQRVEVEVEEPEELEWDPRTRQMQGGDEVEMGGVDDEMLGNAGGGENGIDADADAGMESPDRESSDEGEEVQALMDSAMDAQTPAPIPMVTDDPPAEAPAILGM